MPLTAVLWSQLQLKKTVCVRLSILLKVGIMQSKSLSYDLAYILWPINMLFLKEIDSYLTAETIISRKATRSKNWDYLIRYTVSTWLVLIEISDHYPFINAKCLQIRVWILTESTKFISCSWFALLMLSRREPSNFPNQLMRHVDSVIDFYFHCYH